VEIRGNVNTRLSRVHEPLGSERYLDGVVLAFAGLIRLWADEKGRAELTKLLRGVRWMVLPLRECPTAPAQGALAVECRADDTRAREVLSKLHDPQTEVCVAQEREILAEWGGGCHQRLGATAQTHAALGMLMQVRGVKPTGESVDEVRWPGSPERPAATTAVWDGKHWRKQAETVGSAAEVAVMRTAGLPALAGRAVFVAHSRASADAIGERLSGARVWTSGTSSWFDQAARGIWVEGCTENLGYEAFLSTLQQGVLGLPPREEWIVLTHEGGLRSWSPEKAFATYDAPQSGYSDAAKAALKAAKHVFWSSGSQFDALKDQVGEKVVHACGAGKTAEHLRGQGLEPKVFPSIQEWREWLKD
jgi:hydroxymethylbilane synthase